MAFCQQCGAEMAPESEFCKECGNETGTETTANTQTPEKTYEHPGEDGFNAKHAIIVGLTGLIPTIILAIILPGGYGAAGLLGVPLFAYLGYQRPTIKTAFGRQSFWSAVLLFISPIMMLIHTAVFIGGETEGTAEEAGAAIGGTILIILAFFIGLPLGIAFYLIHRRYEIDD